MKKISKFILKFSIIISLIIGILFVASKLLEQKIVDKAITILNNQINVPVYVDDISFSLLKKFPNATLQLNDVALLSAKDFNRSYFDSINADTLLFIEELYLSISLPELLNNNLNITKAYIQNGYFNILVDEKGKENYKILANNSIKLESDNSENNFEFLLRHIQLKKVNVNFINKYKNTSASITAPLYNINGKFYKKEYTANSEGELQLNYFEQGNLKIHPETPADIDIKLSVSNNQIEIIQSSLETKYYKFTTKGNITFETPTKVDLKIIGNSTNTNKLINLFFTNNLNAYLSKGQLGISAIINGNIDSKETPTIAANFKLVNGRINNNNDITLIDTVELDGSYSNGNSHNLKTSSININNLLLATKQSRVTSVISIKNFDNPSINASGKAILDIADINPFIIDNPDYTFGGKIDGEFNCQCIIDTGLLISTKNLISWNKSAKFNITDGKFISNHKNISITELNGKLNINDNFLSINTFNSTIQNSVIEGDITIKNYLSPIIDSTYPIEINGDIIADTINYKDYEHFFESDSSNNYSRKTIFNGTVKANRILYNKLITDDVSGIIHFDKNILRLTDLKFKTMEGIVLCDINYITKSNKKSTLQTYVSTKSVNIKTLFSTFNNFNQTFIKDENIDGFLTTNFDLEMDFINGKLKPSSISFLGHSRVNNGKLINFEPIIQASKFSGNEDMQNIEFTTLETNILISSGTVNIPKIEIESNAFDISLFGHHKFTGDYEYHMRIYLSDFIGSKSKRLAKQQSEFGYIEDDGYGKTTLFLLATSKNGKSKIKLDGDEVKKNMKFNANDEKQEFKKALHDQFGWFKKDTTLENRKKPKKQEFIIEWDEE